MDSIERQNLLKSFCDQLRLMNYCNSSIKSYAGCVSVFLNYQTKRPYDITESEIKEYLLQSKSSAYLKQQIGALKLFYKYIVRQPLKFKFIPYPRKDYKEPILLSVPEIQALIDASVSNLKHKSIICLLYSTGIRISELLNLKIKDIDSANMAIHLRQAKGHKDRTVPLDNKVLLLLREYFRQYKPNEYLFEGATEGKYTESSVRELLKHYATKAGIKKRIHPHLLRHCYATRMIGNKVNLLTVQSLLGHKNSKTTERYYHLSIPYSEEIESPIKNIAV